MLPPHALGVYIIAVHANDSSHFRLQGKYHALNDLMRALMVLKGPVTLVLGQASAPFLPPFTSDNICQPKNLESLHLGPENHRKHREVKRVRNVVDSRYSIHSTTHSDKSLYSSL